MKTDIKKQENGGAKSWIKAHLSDIIPVLGLILVLVFFNAVSGGKVFTKTNFNTLFNEAFSLLIVTYALIFVMAQGKNDMSLGGVVGTCGGTCGTRIIYKRQFGPAGCAAGRTAVRPAERLDCYGA